MWSLRRWIEWREDDFTFLQSSAKGANSYQPGAPSQERMKQRLRAEGPDYSFAAPRVPVLNPNSELGTTPALGRRWTRPASNPLRSLPTMDLLENLSPSKFSARARKTTPGAGAVPFLFRSSEFGLNRAFSARITMTTHDNVSWGVASGWNKAVPLALNRCAEFHRSLNPFRLERSRGPESVPAKANAC